MVIEIASFNDLFELALDVVQKLLVPTKRTRWLYLLSALCMAVYVYHRHKKDHAGTSLRQFLFPRSVWLHRSAITDYVYVLLMTPLWAALVAPWFLSSTQVGNETLAVLTEWFGAWERQATATLGVAVAYTIALLLADDFSRYWIHRALHRLPLLWEFHKVHHSAEVLTPFSLYRVHIVENLVGSGGYALSVGIVTGIFLYLFPDELSPLTVFGINVGRFVFFLVGSNLRHSHIWLSFGPVLEHVFVSPAQHQIHHSSDPRHLDCNFGSEFALWDWMFGSLYVTKGRENLVFGLGEQENRRLSSIVQLYVNPFVAVARRLFGGAAPQPG